MRQEKFKVSDELKTGTATALFDYIAESVGNFISTLETQEKKETDEPLFLGFTFSFPVQQTALESGTLINWTKVGREHEACYSHMPDTLGHTSTMSDMLILLSVSPHSNRASLLPAQLAKMSCSYCRMH